MRPCDQRRRVRQAPRAFTLVELLVVVAIIGVLVALLVPAVQAARESARRISCTNNIKQIALSLLSYHDQHGQFPTGVYGDVNEKKRKHEDGLGWASRILPNLEQQAIFDRIKNNGVTDFDGDPWKPGIFKAAFDATKRPIGGGDTVLTMFRCPSSDLPTHLPDGDEFVGAGPYPGSGYAVSDYKASRGPCDLGMFWRVQEGLKSGTCYSDINGDGVLDAINKDGGMSRIRMVDVTDGTTHTIALGEAAYVPSFQAFPMWLGSWKEDGTTLFKTEYPVNCNIGGAGYPLSEVDSLRLPGGNGTDDCTFSWHPGGAFFGFVDGSVHFLSEDLEVRTFMLLGNRIDGEVVGQYN
jgi:prepilin-type N-terminal cleavage/methylation domain-containing protein